MKILLCTLLLFTLPAAALAQRTANIPLNDTDIPLIHDLTGARQQVDFDEPVYARMWVVVTQAGAPRVRGEVIMTQTTPALQYKALLARHDPFHSEWEPADNIRLRLEMETPVPQGGRESFTTWTSNETLVFPPLRGPRAGQVNVSVLNPETMPLDTDHTLMTINEAVQDNNGLQIDTRRIEVKIRFSKNVLQTLLK